MGEENTTIAEWDIERALQARYRTDNDVLQRYFSIGEGEPRDVIQKIRPVLEGFCRNLFPAQFLDGDMMGVIVGKIRIAGPSHTLYAIADDLDEINIYCRSISSRGESERCERNNRRYRASGVCKAHALFDGLPSLAHPLISAPELIVEE